MANCTSRQGITAQCNTCEGIGHYANDCPNSKAKGDSKGGKGSGGKDQGGKAKGKGWGKDKGGQIWGKGKGKGKGWGKGKGKSMNAFDYGESQWDDGSWGSQWDDGSWGNMTWNPNTNAAYSFAPAIQPPQTSLATQPQQQAPVAPATPAAPAAPAAAAVPSWLRRLCCFKEIVKVSTEIPTCHIRLNEDGFNDCIRWQHVLGKQNGDRAKK